MELSWLKGIMDVGNSKPTFVEGPRGDYFHIDSTGRMRHRTEYDIPVKFNYNLATYCVSR